MSPPPEPLPPSRDQRRHQRRSRRSQRRMAQGRPLTHRERLYFHDPHCAYCQRGLPLDLLTIDHVIPRARGGGNSLTNKVLACQFCNRRKGAGLREPARRHNLQD